MLYSAGEKNFILVVQKKLKKNVQVFCQDPTYDQTQSCTRCCKFAAFALSLWKQSALSTYTVLFSGGHAFGVSESVVLIVAHRALQMGPSIPAVYEWRGARKF